MTFQFHISGNDAEQITDAVAATIEETFAEKPQRSTAPAPAKAANTRGIDPMTAATLVLTIPGTIFTCLQLADRLKKKPKVEHLLSEIRKMVKDKPNAKIRIEQPDGTLIAIETAEASQLIEAANKKQD